MEHEEYRIIELTFSEATIKALEYKCGKIENDKDLCDAIAEAISTFLEL